MLTGISTQTLTAPPIWENPDKYGACAMGRDGLDFCGRVPQGLLQDSALCSFNCLRETIIISQCLVQCLPATIKCNLQNKNTRKGILDVLGTVQGQLERTILSGLQLRVQFIIIHRMLLKRSSFLHIWYFHRHLLACRKCN